MGWCGRGALLERPNRFPQHSRFNQRASKPLSTSARRCSSPTVPAQRKRTCDVCSRNVRNWFRCASRWGTPVPRRTIPRRSSPVACAHLRPPPTMRRCWPPGLGCPGNAGGWRKRPARACAAPQRDNSFRLRVAWRACLREGARRRLSKRRTSPLVRARAGMGQGGSGSLADGCFVSALHAGLASSIPFCAHSRRLRCRTGFG